MPYLRCIADGGVRSVGALCDINGLADVVADEISPSDIFDVSSSPATGVTVTSHEHFFSWPRLDPGGAGRAVEDDVLEEDVLDIVRLGWILPNGPDWHASRAVACHIPDVKTGRVTLYRDAIVA